MRGGGGGLFAQDLKAHAMIGLVATTERFGRRESRVVCSISYPAVAFVHLSFVSRIAKHCTLPVSLGCTLCALPKLRIGDPLADSRV